MTWPAGSSGGCSRFTAICSIPASDGHVNVRIDLGNHQQDWVQKCVCAFVCGQSGLCKQHSQRSTHGCAREQRFREPAARICRSPGNNTSKCVPVPQTTWESGCASSTWNAWRMPTLVQNAVNGLPF